MYFTRNYHEIYLSKIKISSKSHDSIVFKQESVPNQVKSLSFKNSREAGMTTYT